MDVILEFPTGERSYTSAIHVNIVTNPLIFRINRFDMYLQLNKLINVQYTRNNCEFVVDSKFLNECYRILFGLEPKWVRHFDHDSSNPNDPDPTRQDVSEQIRKTQNPAPITRIIQSSH
ncbi:hypothetical protein L1887_01414 [Cichorium endivia]|nr:hypothetical protein L1887_01414 [Cichorium endivia]